MAGTTGHINHPQVSWVLEAPPGQVLGEGGHALVRVPVGDVGYMGLELVVGGGISPVTLNT